MHNNSEMYEFKTRCNFEIGEQSTRGNFVILTDFHLNL